jgi:large subunit ribosomal protein L1
MAKHGKKYIDAAKLIDADKFYSPKEAVELVKKTAVTKFDSSVDVSFRLGINPKYADQ